MAPFNFECHQNTELKRRAAQTATFRCYKKSALWLSVMNVITLKLTAIIVFRKQRQKLELVSFKALYNAKGKSGGGEVL